MAHPTHQLPMRGRTPFRPAPCGCLDCGGTPFNASRASENQEWRRQLRGAFDEFDGSDLGYAKVLSGLSDERLRAALASGDE